MLRMTLRSLRGSLRAHRILSDQSGFRNHFNAAGIKLPNGEVFVPYQMNNSMWSHIQEMRQQMEKRNPLAGEVLNRMTIEGMSLGSLSPLTHGHIAKVAMALNGARTYAELIEKYYQSEHILMSNAGEGGDINQHLIKQIASARFGVDLDYILEAVMLQFKAAQGVKPGVGGSLAGLKVSDLIASIRNCMPWTSLHSPGPHADQYSIEDLAILVRAYLAANPKLTWSVKLAAEPGVDTIALGSLKALGMSPSGRRNEIVITGQGSTGNTPLFTKYHAAYPWLVGLSRTHAKLVEAGLRDSANLMASGGFVGSFFAPFLWGADRVGIGTLALIGDGCIMVRKCHDNTCPTGVATLDPALMAKNKGSPLTIARVLLGAAELTAIEMQPYFDHVSQAIGRAAILEPILDGPLIGHEELLNRMRKKPRYISLGNLPLQQGPSYKEREIIEKIHSNLQNVFDVQAENSELGFGASISAYSRKDETVRKMVETNGITINITGSPGQKLAVLGAAGITFNASGTHTNDGTGQSLSGATVIAETCGAHAGFGMTKGRVITRGVGSRGAIRKSGGSFITEVAGAFFANFHTRGETIILGFPNHYPNLQIELDHYKSPFAFKKHALGFGFLSGFSGGTIIMPQALWTEALQLKHVSPGIRDHVTTASLAENDKIELMLALEEAIHLHGNILQRAILTAIKKIPALIDKWFIKILPPKQNTPAFAIGQIALAEEKLPPPIRDPQLVSVQKRHDKPNSDILRPDRERAACGTGLVRHLDGKATHDIVKLGVDGLIHSEHRGAGSNDPLSSDGNGVLIVFGDGFFKAQPEFANLQLEQGKFAVVTVFMPIDNSDFIKVEEQLKESLAIYGLQFAAKRKIPTNERMLGVQAKKDQLQLLHYIVLTPAQKSAEQFDADLSKCYLHFEFTIQQMMMPHRAHCCSASRRFIIYKSKGKEKYIRDIYPDLNHPLLTASMVLTHSRFATNTDTLIENVQPLSDSMYNGEINNLRRFIDAIKYNAKLSHLLQVDISKIDFSRYSDSAIMAFYIRMLQLFGYDSEQINQAIFHPYDPRGENSVSEFHNLIGMPGLEGPNGSIRLYESGETFKVTIEMDSMGWRPHRGMIDSKRRLLVTGSEFGIVPGLEGDLIELGPGDAFEIDHSTGHFKLLTRSADLERSHNEKLAHISLVKSSESYEAVPLSMSYEELQERKLRAGITPEMEKTFLIPMFNDGNGFTKSMGDDGGPEVTISGPTRVINTIKTSFAQITRPPLDYLREGETMIGHCFIGSRPALDKMHASHIVGLRVDSPIIDNEEMHTLITSSKLSVLTIDITYPVRGREQAMLQALDAVCSKSVTAADNDINLIVLSDIKSDDIHASLLPILVAGAVDSALKKAGIRHKVSLCLQSGICATPLEQIAALACGINLINPYLIFMPDKLFAENKAEFKRQRKSYKTIALKENYAASARAGVRTLPGYTGAGLITALGLDADVANTIGIYSELGGFDWANIAASTVDMHMRPGNIGKYIYEGQAARAGRLNVALVSMWRSIATGEKILTELRPEMLRNIRGAEKDTLEGQFKLKPPGIWTTENPMPIRIIGGGAAGFMMARALLDSPMGNKIKIEIIEENPANLFGMIKDGIAPDKLAIRQMQFTLLSQCVKDPRVLYSGGVKVGKKKESDVSVTYDELLNDSPCVIDARGAPRDRELSEVIGHEFFTSASSVWKAYNGYFDPYNPDRYWPFHDTRSQVKIVVGNGNVAADIIRLLLSNTEGHPAFQDRSRKQGPKFIRNIARGPVTQCKITLKELESFAKNGIRVCANFDENNIEESSLNEEQRNILAFFRRVKHNTSNLLIDDKCVHFHFGCVPKRVYPVGRNIFELEVERENGQIETFRGGDIISAVGREKSEEAFVTPYVIGWATGNGGNLGIIQSSVNPIKDRIVTEFEQRQFDHTVAPPPERKYQARAPVTNQGLLNILAYFNDGNPLDTAQQWRKARDYQAPSLNTVDEQIDVPVVAAPMKNDSVAKDAIQIIDGKSQQFVVIKTGVASGVTIYKALKKAAERDASVPIPQNDCGELGTCVRCVAEVKPPIKPTHTPLEKSLLPTLFGNKDASRKILTCQHPANDLNGATVVITYTERSLKT